MGLNFLKKICVKNIDELQNFSKYLENTRLELSYFKFRDESNFTNNFNSQSLMIVPFIKISLYVFIIIISLFSNLLIIFIISLNPCMRKSTNYFILNLAVCNLSILFSNIWVQILTCLSPFWHLGEIYCKINSYLQMVSIIASVFTLTMILYDRYIGVMYPLEAKLKITNSKSVQFILISWVLAFIIAIPTYVFRTYTERQWADFTEKYCDDFGWPIYLVKNNVTSCIVKITRPLKRIYYTCVILILFFIPVIIMAITYTIIIKKLWKLEIIGEVSSFNKEAFVKKRNKVIITCVTIFGIFSICWLPLETMLLYMEYAESFPKWWSELEWMSYFLAYSNTAINPYLYAGISENYRECFFKLRQQLSITHNSKKNNAFRLTNISSIRKNKNNDRHQINNFNRNDS